MKPIKVILANRSEGCFWSIEELFSNIYSALPDWVKCTVMSAPRGRAHLPSLLTNAFWLGSLKNYDVIHQTGDIHYAILGSWSRPVVLTIHDLRFVEEARGLKRFFFWCFWIYFPCMRANRVTVISEFTKGRLLALCPIKRAKVRVIPNCVGQEFKRVPKPWPSDKPRLLQVGTTDNKNLRRVIEACVGLPIQVCILGKLTEVQREQLDDQGIEYEVFFDLPKERVVALYAASDLVVFASTYEGFGLPILEAQAVGRPVLTSALSPMREVAGGGALLVDPLNIEDIRSGLLRLVDDAELRQQIVSAGFRNVCKYSASAVALQYVEVYREVLKD